MIDGIQIENEGEKVVIITQKKPIEELMAMIGDAKKIAILGCGSCATACATGGEKEIAELSAYLEAHGKKVVATGMADYCCMNLGVKTAVKKLNAAEPDAVVCMSCGDGVQLRVYRRRECCRIGEHGSARAGNDS